VRQSEGVAMYGGRDECLRAAVAVVPVPLLVGWAIMLDLKHEPISLFQERTNGNQVITKTGLLKVRTHQCGNQSANNYFCYDRWPIILCKLIKNKTIKTKIKLINH